MSNYGYNPDEHFQTKVTLIDKDGFHKESDEVPSGGSSEGLEEGFYAREYVNTSNGHNVVYLKLIIDCSNKLDTYEETDDYYSSGGPITSCLYFGEKLDESKFRFGIDTILYDNESLFDYFYESDIIHVYDLIYNEIRINKNFTIINGRLDSDYYNDIYNDVVTNIHNDVPVHYVAYYSSSSTFVFLDGIINLEE